MRVFLINYLCANFQALFFYDTGDISLKVDFCC